MRMSTTLLGVIYLGLPLALLVSMRELPHGAAAIVCVLVGVWIFDTASYVGGRLWGRRPIAPLTSPKKTVEGALVGLVVATFAVWVAGLYMDWIDGWQSLLLGLAICPAAFLGDLFESMIKRDAGAKDSGRLLMGHGGVLDRFDALLFGGTAAYFVLDLARCSEGAPREPRPAHRRCARPPAPRGARSASARSSSASWSPPPTRSRSTRSATSSPAAPAAAGRG